MESLSRKNIIYFITMCILAVYSQYGAVFPVVAMAGLAFFKTLREKKGGIIFLLSSYLFAIVCAGLPLYCLFLRKQMMNQKEVGTIAQPFQFEINLVYDLFKNLLNVFQWNLMSYMNEKIALFFVLVFIVGFIFVYLNSESIYRSLIIVNIITWILYYIAVKSSCYGYGYFGGSGRYESKYNLFFIPLWIITNFIVGYRVFEMIKGSENISYRHIHQIYAAIAIGLCFCYCLVAWNKYVANNWTKEHNRLVVQIWYEKNAGEIPTLVYYGADAGFAYYIRQDDEYSIDIEKQVTYMPWLRNKSEKEYVEYLNFVYGTKWPKQLFVAATHNQEDFNVLVNAFVNRGWSRENFLTGDGTLIRLTQLAQKGNIAKKCEK